MKKFIFSLFVLTSISTFADTTCGTVGTVGLQDGKERYGVLEIIVENQLLTRTVLGNLSPAAFDIFLAAKKSNLTVCVSGEGLTRTVYIR